MSNDPALTHTPECEITRRGEWTRRKFHSSATKTLCTCHIPGGTEDGDTGDGSEEGRASTEERGDTSSDGRGRYDGCRDSATSSSPHNTGDPIRNNDPNRKDTERRGEDVVATPLSADTRLTEAREATDRASTCLGIRERIHERTLTDTLLTTQREEIARLKAELAIDPDDLFSRNVELEAEVASLREQVEHAKKTGLLECQAKQKAWDEAELLREQVEGLELNLKAVSNVLETYPGGEALKPNGRRRGYHDQAFAVASKLQIERDALRERVKQLEGALTEIKDMRDHDKRIGNRVDAALAEGGG